MATILISTLKHTYLYAVMQFFRDRLFRGERIDVRLDARVHAPADDEEGPESGPKPLSKPLSSSAKKGLKKGSTTIGNAIIPPRQHTRLAQRKDYTVPIWLRAPPEKEDAGSKASGTTGEEGHELDQSADKDNGNAKEKEKEKYHPQWAFFKFDAKASVRRVFLIELHWIVSDSWLIDDLVNILYVNVGMLHVWVVILSQNGMGFLDLLFF